MAKICNNLVLGISMMGMAEAMSRGVLLGIDPAVLTGIINTSTGRCWTSDTYNPYPDVLPNAPVACDYSGGFAAALMLKDLGLATEAARHAKQPVWRDNKYLSDSITSWASRRLHTPAPVTIDCRTPFPGCRMHAIDTTLPCGVVIGVLNTRWPRVFLCCSMLRLGSLFQAG